MIGLRAVIPDEAAASAPQPARNALTDTRIAALADQMTVAEQVSLLSGQDFWPLTDRNFAGFSTAKAKWIVEPVPYGIEARVSAANLPL